MNRLKMDVDLEKQTRDVISVVFNIFAGLPHQVPHSDTETTPVVTAVVRIVNSLAVKHGMKFKGMIAQLNLEQKGEDVSFIKSVATEVFSDGITSWGRIASLLTFGAMVCKHQNDRGLSKCVSLVGEEISSYLLTAQLDWLLKNKGWDGFVEYFHVLDTEAAVRNPH